MTHAEIAGTFPNIKIINGILLCNKVLHLPGADNSDINIARVDCIKSEMALSVKDIQACIYLNKNSTYVTVGNTTTLVDVDYITLVKIWEAYK